MTTALTWTIKAVTPHSNITTVRTIFWIGVSQTAWCMERCFSTVTNNLLKQDGSSPTSKPHTTDGWSEHKNPCEAKIKLNQLHNNSVVSTYFYTTSLSVIQRLTNVSSTSPFRTNSTSIQDNAIITELQAFIACSRSGMLEGVPGRAFMRSHNRVQIMKFQIF